MDHTIDAGIAIVILIIGAILVTAWVLFFDRD